MCVRAEFANRLPVSGIWDPSGHMLLPTIFRNCSQHVEMEKTYPYFKKLRSEKHRHTALTGGFNPAWARESAAAKAHSCLHFRLPGSMRQESWFWRFPQVSAMSSQRQEPESVLNSHHGWGVGGELWRKRVGSCKSLWNDRRQPWRWEEVACGQDISRRSGCSGKFKVSVILLHIQWASPVRLSASR